VRDRNATDNEETGMSAPVRIVTDVAVIGGGIAGLCAAVRAAEAGRRVLVFEKTDADRYVCSSRLTSGIFHSCMNDIRRDPDVIEAEIMETTGGHADPRLARMIGADAMRVVRWLQSVGIRFIKGPMDHHAFMLSPPTLTPSGRNWEGRGGDVLLRTLETALQKHAGAIRRGHRVEALSQEDRSVVGLRGVDARGAPFQVTAAAVVIADGGFQMNPDVTRGPITPEPSRILQRNGRTGMGDGLAMARAVGAAMSDLRGFYGHVQSKDALANDGLWPYPWLDFVAAGGMIVTADGRRFDDEGLGGVHMANSIAALPDPGGTVVIADQAIWDHPDHGRFFLLPPNPYLEEWGGTVHRADTIAALAARAGIDAAGLAASVALHNQAVRDGTTAHLQPPRSADRLRPLPIERAPYIAVPVVAGVTYTMGGIRIDDHARVLDTSGEPIAGLYAAGCCTGGLEGGASRGYVGGLIKSSITGLRAGEHIGLLAGQPIGQRT